MTTETRPAYLAARAAGRCPSCANRPDDGYVYCAACRARMARTNRATGAPARRQARFCAESRCLDCHAVRADVRGKAPRCNDCRAAYATYRTRVRAARRRQALCAECGKEPATGYYAGLGPHCSERHSRSKAKRRRAA